MEEKKESTFGILKNIIRNYGNRKSYMEKRLENIEKVIERLDNYHKDHPPLVIEKIYVDKIEVEKFDLNNNIGALGVKELGGTLNIGANYGNSNLPKDNKKENDKKQLSGENKKENNDDNELKVNIKGKKSNT